LRARASRSYGHSADDGKFSDDAWCDTDLSAAVSIGEALLPVLHRKFPVPDDGLIYDAIVDAILEWHHARRSIDDRPSEAYLFNAAKRNAINAVKAENARQMRERRWCRESMNTNTVSTLDDRGRLVHAVRAIDRLLGDDRMRAVFRLVARGERKTAAFAEVLGLDHLPVREQRREVKREKDRLWKYVRRNTRIAAIARRALM